MASLNGSESAVDDHFPIVPAISSGMPGPSEGDMLSSFTPHFRVWLPLFTIRIRLRESLRKLQD